MTCPACVVAAPTVVPTAIAALSAVVSASYYAVSSANPAVVSIVGALAVPAIGGFVIIPAIINTSIISTIGVFAFLTATSGVNIKFALEAYDAWSRGDSRSDEHATISVIFACISSYNYPVWLTKSAIIPAAITGLYAINSMISYFSDDVTTPVKKYGEDVPVYECIDKFCKDIDPDLKKAIKVENSTIFGAGGKILFYGDDNDRSVEKYYFSLCTTKPTNEGTLNSIFRTPNIVNKIYNFNDTQDSLNFFCTKEKISKEDVVVEYRKGDNTSFIKVKDIYRVALAGKHDSNAEYINLNRNFNELVNDNNLKVHELPQTSILDYILDF